MIGYNHKDAVTTWPEGEYEAVLNEVIEDRSKAGNDMYKLTWRLYSKGGREITLFDYIVFPAAVWKLKQLAKAFNAVSEFDADRFDPRRYTNRTIRVNLGVQNNPGYGEQNRIDEYIAGSAQGSAPAQQQTQRQEVPPDDDIPF